MSVSATTCLQPMMVQPTMEQKWSGQVLAFCSSNKWLGDISSFAWLCGENRHE